ncbi:hypothetical protein H632_c3848p0 [Helicosporidium sp. ATCC 50920]|nr:hypothetical protein H632_c3848p0 [Helicosporidium sp. ATCC 50920]|eukprot:KDD72111.1 hypothetical protein H632_c3848p0 [Helicosporidium sp. ATCC 50920]
MTIQLLGTVVLTIAVVMVALRFMAALSRPQPPAPSKGAKKELRVFSREEVARHNTPEDFWLILKNRETDRLCVYDLTEYLDSHPGGEVILTNAGGDATPGFYGPQHPPSVHDLVREYHIGYLGEAGDEHPAKKDD